MSAPQDNPGKRSEVKNENPAVPEKRENVTITIKLNDFIQKYRKEFFIILAALVIILAAVIIGFAVRDKLRADAYSQVDAFNGRYEALRFFMGSEEPDAAEKQADIDALIADLEIFTRKNSGFPAARAYVLSAGIYEAEKKWSEAEVLWKAAADAAGKSYLAPIAVFNAAVAAEEQGNIDPAIELYTRALGYDSAFPLAARAQFSIGRLRESQNNKEAAIEAYRNLIGKWPNDPVWANLAQSRLVVLTE